MVSSRGTIDAAIFGLAAFVFLAFGSWAYGLDIATEYENLQRALAWAGEPVASVSEAPRMPIALRSMPWLLTGSVSDPRWWWTLRLTHAMATACTATLAFVWARRRMESSMWALLAGLVVLSQGEAMVSARLSTGHAIEAAVHFATIAVGINTTHRRAEHGSGVLVWIGFAALLAMSGFASGLVLGPGMALLSLAWLSPPGGGRRWIIATAMMVLAMGLGLWWIQGDGYLPLLGATKHADLRLFPAQRRIFDGLVEWGGAVFPWSGWVVAGCMVQRARPFVGWLAAVGSVGAIWSLAYGPTSLPTAVPVALVVTMVLQAMVSEQTDAWARRWIGLVITLTTLALWKGGLPSWEHGFSTTDPSIAPWLGWMSAAQLVVVATVLLACRRSASQPWMPLSLVLGLALVTSGSFIHGVLPRCVSHRSFVRLLERHQEWVKHKRVPPEFYGLGLSEPEVMLASRVATVRRLARVEGVLSVWKAAPTTVVLVSSSLAAKLHAKARTLGTSLAVLDARHPDWRLVALNSPLGVESQNPWSEVVLDQIPVVEHPSSIAFDNAMSLIGWSLSGSTIRGRTVILTLVFRAHQALPSGTSVDARFVLGRLSRFHENASPITHGVYPPPLWRAGDIIVHRETIDIPLVEAMPGDYDIVVAIRKGGERLLNASGEGIRIMDRRGGFAAIGRVMIY